MLGNEKKPNLFLIGAPKSGTTSMTHYLSQIPEVFFPRKELHYFATSHRGRPIKDIHTYLNLFNDAHSHHKWLLDSSTLYLYFKESAQNIIQFNPDARFIVMMRDPLTMVPAWFEQRQKSPTMRETAARLEDAWALLQERRAGTDLPAGCVEPRLLYYDEIARYGEQFKSLLDFVPREQIHVILFDDLVRDPRKTFHSVCSFIGLQCPNNITFDKLNYLSTFRFDFVKRVYFLSWLRPIWLKFLRLSGTSVHFSPALFRLLYKPLEKKKISEEVEASILESYREDVKILEHSLGISLSHWLREGT